MAVKIQLHYERIETTVIEHELTPAQYAEFLKQHKESANTAELGEWVAANCGGGKEVDCYGSRDSEITCVYNSFEHEYIQD